MRAAVSGAAIALGREHVRTYYLVTYFGVNTHSFTLSCFREFHCMSRYRTGMAVSCNLAAFFAESCRIQDATLCSVQKSSVHSRSAIPRPWFCGPAVVPGSQGGCLAIPGNHKVDTGIALRFFVFEVRVHPRSSVRIYIFFKCAGVLRS